MNDRLCGLRDGSSQGSNAAVNARGLSKREREYLAERVRFRSNFSILRLKNQAFKEDV